MTDTFIIGRLSRYGTVISFRRDLLASGIYNGICTARMRVLKHIPSSLYIAGELVFVNYQSQPRMCCKCSEEGHQASSCSSVRCFNCETSGHRIEDCSEPEHCKICSDTEHNTCRCPFFVWSVNVEQSTPGTSGTEQKSAERKENRRDQPKKEAKINNNDNKAPPSQPREQRDHVKHRE